MRYIPELLLTLAGLLLAWAFVNLLHIALS